MQIIRTAVLLTLMVLQSSCYLSLLHKPNQETVAKLKERYAVNLGSNWTTEQADNLLAIFDAIYNSAEDNDYQKDPSMWKISNNEMEEDLVIDSVNSLRRVTINSDVFSIEAPQTEAAKEEENYNKRLFRVVAQFVTENWKDMSAVKRLLKDGSDRYVIELVLKEVYGLSLVRKDTPEFDKISQKLHKYVGKVHISRFTNQELMMLMTVYERFPQRLHKIPRLKYLLLSEKAPYAGSAWIVADCVEYAALTFRIQNEAEFKRIILHEKAHFLWEYALNGKLRKQWSDIGGWRKDPKSQYNWSNTRNRKEFVTTYASVKNPNEDWAESVAFYLFNPNRLRTCSLAKYEFVEQVMDKYREGSVPFKRLTDLEN